MWLAKTIFSTMTTAGPEQRCWVLHSIATTLVLAAVSSMVWFARIKFKKQLWQACSQGHLGSAKWLSKVCAVNAIQAKDSLGRSMLFVACLQGHLELAQWLFEVGAADDIRTMDNDGSTPMDAACEGGHLDVAKWLYEVGAAEDIQTKDNRGFTPMHLVCFSGRLDVAKWLFKVSGAIEVVRAQNDDGSTPMIVACRAGRLDVAKWLFAVGAAADIRTRNVDGFTPMYVACSDGHLDVATWLFEVGAAEDIHSPTDKFGDIDTPMHAACIFDHYDVARWLLLQGTANNDKGHVDQAILRDFIPRHWPGLCAALEYSLRVLVEEHRNFTSVVLTATRFHAEVVTEPKRRSIVAADKCNHKNGLYGCMLTRLCGHEGSLLCLISDFAGVLRGRPLRNAREALSCLGCVDMEREGAHRRTGGYSGII